MPTIDVVYNELIQILDLDKKPTISQLDDLLAFVKSEIKNYDKKTDVLTLELKDTNRPDLWSVEGLARALKSYKNIKTGIHYYTIAESLTNVTVDPLLQNIRPFIACSIIQNITLTDNIIKSLMHLQDKLHQTYGRNRQKTSIGLYDYNLISFPLVYKATKPTAFSFVPLGSLEKMNLEEILTYHPKGLEYGHIVKKHSLYPILIDSKQNVLSFPPIVNSNDLGKITSNTRNLLIEVTGTHHQAVLNTLNLITTALIDRHGAAYSILINYPKNYPVKTHVTPDFKNREVKLEIVYVNQILGLDLSSKEIASLLLKAGFGIKKIYSSALQVIVPFYRIDIMHPIDVVEDVAIAFGYNNIQPLWQDLPTIGCERPEQKFVNVLREIMVGLGFQEILTYTLTNPDVLFRKMNLKPSSTVEIVNPKVATMTCLRTWLLPGLMEFFNNNQSVEFPQKIFELGKVTLKDLRTETQTTDYEVLAAAISHVNAGFSEIKSCLDALFRNTGLTWNIQPVNNSSFIDGRAGTVLVDEQKIGVIGEINPVVLENWGLKNPTVAFEINLEKIFKDKLIP